MTGNGSQSSHPDLLEVLVEHRLISPAQANLVNADKEATGMTVAEIVVARHWVNETTLKAVAPWLDGEISAPAPHAVPGTTSDTEHMSDTDTYQQNLFTYKNLMRKILGNVYED